MKKNDIVIKVNPENRQVYFNDNFAGVNAENLQSNLVFEFDGEFVNGTPRVEVIKNGEKYIITEVSRVNDTYVMEIKSSLLDANTIDMQLVITEAGEEEIPIFKSKQFYLIVGESINASTELPDEYETLYDQIQEKIAEVNNLNVTGERVSDGVEITFTDKLGNETTKKVNDGEKGDTGATGPQGEQGIQGPQGPQGDDYVITQQDYETIADIVKTDIRPILETKADKVNPTGTGKLQINGLAQGVNSVALGNNVTAYGDNSFVEGSSDNIATDITTVQDIENAVDENNPNSEQLLSDWQNNKFSLAGGESSFVQGTNSLALGKNSMSLGNGNIAENSSAFASGTGTHASGKYSFTSGLETVASGQGSIAIGQRVKATGSSAIALGYNNTNFEDYNATGARSLTIGLNNKATGEDSVAIGRGLTVSDSSRTAVGRYNQDISGGLFLVGNGGGDNSRSNAFYVDITGRAYIKANLLGNENEKALVDLKYLREYAQQYLPNRKILTKTVDVDNAKEAGFYQVDFTYRLNGEYIYGEMISIPYKSSESGKDYGAQLFFATGDYSNGYQNCFWYRTFNGTSWNSWVKVDPSVYARTNQNNNFSTAQTVNGTLTVNGDIVQSGSSYETHAEQLFTKNDIIKTRDGAVGGLGNNEVTGLEAIKYDGTNNGRLVFDNTGTARVGDVGDEVPLLARDETTNLTNGQVLVWDSNDLIAKGSSDYVEKTYKGTNSTIGLLRGNPDSGTTITSVGAIAISAATEAQIEAKTNSYKPIVPSNLDYAVGSVKASQTQSGTAKMWTSTNEDNEIGLNISTE